MGESLGDAAARGTGVTLGIQAVRFLLQMVAVVVLTRLLLPEDFGLVAMVVAISGIAELIRDCGLSLAAMQARDLGDDERTNLFWANTAIGVVCAGAVAASAPLIVGLYGEPRLGPIVVTIAAVFVVTGVGTQFRAELGRSLRFRALAVTDVVAQIAGIVVAIVLAWNGAGPWSVVAQLVVVPCVTTMLNVVACRWRPGLPRPGVSITRFFRFGGGVLGTQLLSYTSKNVDKVAIGALLGPVSLGFYTRGYQLLMAPINQINAPLTQVALPVLARVREDRETHGRYLRRAQLIGCYLTASVLSVCAGLAVPLVAVLFGPGWEPVAPVFAVLAVGGVFQAVAQLSYWAYLSLGLAGAQLRMFLVLRPVMIGLILAGLPWGIEGVAVGCLLGSVLQWWVPLWHVGRVSDVDAGPLIRRSAVTMARISLPLGLLTAGVTLLPVPAAAQILIGLLVAAGYLAALASVVRGVRDDLSVLVHYARRVLDRSGVGGSSSPGASR